MPARRKSKRDEVRSNSSALRVVMVEVVNADQFPGRICSSFPFVRGHLDRLGVPTRWIRFGISTTNLLEHRRDQVTLTEDEFQRLVSVLEEHRPTLVLSTDALYGVQVERIEALLPGVGVHVLGRSPLPGLPGFADYRGYAELDRPGFAPRYDWEPGNAASLRRDIDNVYLLLKGSCGHRRLVSSNPIYQGIHDDRVDGRPGCAFCENWIGPSPVFEATPADWILRQVHGIAKSRAPSGRFPNAILLERLESADVLKGCIDALEETGMASSVRLLFAVRSDQIRFFARLLFEHFERHPESGIRFGTYATGIESFASEDLLRFNKGTTPLDGLAAVNTLRDLATRLPGGFSYTGITFILLTPWTSPETLHLNLGLIRFLDLQGEAGNLFESRLRLHPEVSITCLAERDGLVVDEAPDPVQVMNRRKLFGNERPWRFADERMGPLSSILMRQELLGGSVDDPLVRGIRQRLERAGLDWKDKRDAGVLDLLLCMIDVVRSHDTVLNELDVIERAIDLRDARQQEARARARAARFRIDEERLDLAGLVRRIACLAERRLVPVLSVDDATAAEAASVAAFLEGRGLAHAFLPTPADPTRDRGTLVFGPLREDVDLAVALRGKTIAARDARLRAAAILEAGRLHGVPACCARAFAEGPFADVNLPAWAALARRLETDGPVPAVSNPLRVPALAFVPCTAGCEAAAAAFRARLDAIGVRVPADGEESTLDLFSLDGPGDGELVRLHAVRMDGDAIRYRAPPVPADPSDRLRASLAAGNELLFLPGQIRVRDGGRTLDVLTASTGVWSPVRCWHPEEWSELARSAAFVARRKDPVADASDTRLTVLLQKVVGRFGDCFDAVQPLRVDFAPGSEALRLRIAFTGVPHDFDLHPESGRTDCFLKTAHFAVVCRTGNPPLSSREAGQLATLVQLFDRAVARYAPDLLPGVRPAADRRRPDAPSP